MLHSVFDVPLKMLTIFFLVSNTSCVFVSQFPSSNNENGNNRTKNWLEFMPFDACNQNRNIIYWIWLDFFCVANIQCSTVKYYSALNPLKNCALCFTLNPHISFANEAKQKTPSINCQCGIVIFVFNSINGVN